LIYPLKNIKIIINNYNISKASITFLILLFFVPAISLQAQSNPRINPQTYFVPTGSGLGIIPKTNIDITDTKGRSISCKPRDLKDKNKSIGGIIIPVNFTRHHEKVFSRSKYHQPAINYHIHNK